MNKPGKNGHVYPPLAERDGYTVEWVPINSVKESPENSDIYGDIADDEQMENLIKSIDKRGLEEPILTSADRFILSGHRRRFACEKLGYTHVPVRVRGNVRRKGNSEYHRELIEYNPQRIKTVGTLLKEAPLRDNDVANTYAAIEERRQAAMRVDADFMDVSGSKEITPISDRRQEFWQPFKKLLTTSIHFGRSAFGRFTTSC